MSRKLLFSLTLSLLAAAVLSGGALAADGVTAQPGRPFPGLRRFAVRGEVVSVDSAAGDLRLQTQRGEELIFSVDENTHFRGVAEGLDEIAPGMHAAVLALRRGDAPPLALQVITHPELARARRYSGRVIETAPGGENLSIETPAQERISFQVDEATRFRGGAAELEDLENGQVIVVLAAALDDGQLKALLIFAPERLPDRHFAGDITAIDPAEGTFTVSTRGMEMLTVLTDEETIFLSRGGGLSGVVDLEVGMQVFVRASHLIDGSLVGKYVLVPAQPE